MVEELVAKCRGEAVECVRSFYLEVTRKGCPAIESHEFTPRDGNARIIYASGGVAKYWVECRGTALAEWRPLWVSRLLSDAICGV